MEIGTKIMFNYDGGFYVTYKKFFEDQDDKKFLDYENKYNYCYDDDKYDLTQTFTIIDFGMDRLNNLIYVLKGEDDFIYLNNLLDKEDFTIID